MLLQIFDVTDMTNPVLLHREVIGSRGSNSDATADHLAFNFFGDYLAIPMEQCEGSGASNQYGDVQTFDGLMVYKVSIDDGFTYVGGVDHRDGATDDSSCGGWWTDPDSGVKRSIFMDDYVYSISSGHVKVNHLDALNHDVVDVAIPALNVSRAVEYCGYYWD